MTLKADEHIDGELKLLDSTTLKAVSFGASDSGGSGYKFLRIPNT